MNAEHLEALVLSGELFNGTSGSNSPPRSPSPDADPGWHDEELRAAMEERRSKRDPTIDYDSDDERKDAFAAQIERENQADSIGMGPGRTGVKGVIRDHDEAEEIKRQKHAKEAEETRRKMEANSLGGKTYLEEEREKAFRGLKADELVMKEIQKSQEPRKDVWGQAREGRFGHLREVGLRGFLNAVEKEDQGIWVVVHLYDPSLERCYLLDDKLSRLARIYPDTKFLRAKAASLGFTAPTRTSRPKPSSQVKTLKPLRVDDDDPYGSDTEESPEDDIVDEDDIDLDMLPTLLVYRNGQLVHNWVRVDWEVKDMDIEDFLDKHNILPQRHRHHNLGLPSDDEDEDDFDLLISDDDM
ncbi:thioredoxin-like protein [Coprinopsis marcescibilis]|uniref:Thioredoxin-like protein n=1 Tax=Coprinopsis marcescibilis TaxID=230819 RepID=A0A5C3LC96_COPMA|nr:thioredoxin-like protein [Coprinopsis marcescibilis]